MAETLTLRDGQPQNQGPGIVGPSRTAMSAITAANAHMDNVRWNDAEIRNVFDQIDISPRTQRKTDASSRRGLQQAVARNSPRKVQTLLMQGVDPNFTTDRDLPLIHTIIQLGPSWREVGHKKNTIFLYLVAAGADLNAKDQTGFTVLHRVCEACFDYRLIAITCKFGADVNASIPERGSPLHQVAALEPRGHDGMDNIAALAVYRADLNAQRDGDRMTPLMVAVATGCGTRVQQLLEFGAEVSLVNSTGHNALVLAVERNDVDAVTKLCQFQASPNSRSGTDGCPVLHMAIRQRTHSLAKALLDANADPNLLFEGTTPLFAALEAQLWTIATLLLTSGASAHVHEDSTSTTSALHLALTHIPMMEHLLHAGCPVDTTDDHGLTPLIHACISGHTSSAAFLLTRGADANLRLPTAPDRIDGDTPLLSAIRAQHWDAAHLLLAQGNADATTVTTPHRFSPLHLAATLPSLSRQTIRLLKQHGCPINARDALGATPLYSAVATNQLHNADHLVAEGADPFARLDSGGNILFVATGRVRMLKHLLRNWPALIVNLRDHNGATALHRAAVGGHVEGAKVLMECGAGNDAVAGVVWEDGYLNVGEGRRLGHGGTPADVARAKGHGKLAEWIEGFGSGTARGMGPGVERMIDAPGSV